MILNVNPKGEEKGMNTSARRQNDLANPLNFLLRVPVPWVFVLAYLVGAGLQHLLPVTVVSPKAVQVGMLGGVVLFAAGALFASWSLIIFQKARTTTTPGEVSAVLVTWGPYRFTRNPMYVSLILAYLGEAGILTQVWPLFVLPFTVAYVNWIVIPVEEGRLKEVFQDSYEHYRARVRRWM